MMKSSEDALQTNLSHSMSSYVQYYLSSFEDEVQKIINLRRAYVVNSDFQKLSDLAPILSNFEKTQLVLRVQDHLELIKDSSLYIDEARVYFPSLARTISTNDYQPAWSEEEIASLVHAQLKNETLFEWDNKLVLGQIYPEVLSDPDSFGFALQIQFSKEKINQHLSQIIPSEQSGALLISENHDWNIASGSSEKISGMEEPLVSFMKEIKLDQQKEGQDFIQDKEGNDFFVTFQHSELLHAFLVIAVPKQEALGPLEKYQTWFWNQLLLTIFVILLFSYWIYQIIHRPLRRLLTALRQVERGNLDIQITHRRKDEFQYLYQRFNQMTRKLKQLIQEVYEQKMRSQRSELKQLQSQINPHFLYNSFFILHRMAQIPDIESVKKMTTYLGEYFRFITRTMNDEVALSDEVKHARNYVDIQSMRFGSKIQVAFAALPHAWTNIRVPRLIIQPILENAYQHGLEDQIGQGMLRIRFAQSEKEDAIVIQIEDNGTRLDDDTLVKLQKSLQSVGAYQEVTGLVNVHRRLQLKFGGKGKLNLQRSSELGGLMVEMTIPWEET